MIVSKGAAPQRTAITAGIFQQLHQQLYLYIHAKFQGESHLLFFWKTSMAKSWAIMPYKRKLERWSTWFHDESTQQQQRELLVFHLNILFVGTANNIGWSTFTVVWPTCCKDANTLQPAWHMQQRPATTVSGKRSSPTKGASAHQRTSKTATKW